MSVSQESQCYFIQLQVDSYLDGDLSSAQQDVFMTHVHDCAACAEDSLEEQENDYQQF